MSAPGRGSDKSPVKEKEDKSEEVKPSRGGFGLPLLPFSASRTYRRNEAKRRQVAIMEKSKLNPPKPKKPRVPVSVKVRAEPGDSAHLFSAPVDGEISGIRVRASLGNSQKKVPLRLLLKNGAEIRSEDVVVEQNVPFEMPKPLQMKAGDEFSVEVKSEMNIIATMMFREE